MKNSKFTQKDIYFFIFGYWVSVAACGLSLVAVCGLLIVVASLAVEHRL